MKVTITLLDREDNVNAPIRPGLEPVTIQVSSDPAWDREAVAAMLTHDHTANPGGVAFPELGTAQAMALAMLMEILDLSTLAKIVKEGE